MLNERKSYFILWIGVDVELEICEDPLLETYFCFILCACPCVCALKLVFDYELTYIITAYKLSQFELEVTKKNFLYHECGEY